MCTGSTLGPEEKSRMLPDSGIAIAHVAQNSL